MRRLYKVILILLFGFIFTIIIYYESKSNLINYLALGDGISSGENAYLIDGFSFNDYYRESNIKRIKYFNDDFTKKNYRIEDLINDIKSNKLINNNYIEQLIHNSNIIVISIGMDELTKYSITDNIDKEYINRFIDNYDDLLFIIRKINDKNIIILGLYSNIYLKESNVIITNSKLKDIANKYNSLYIDINDILKDNNYFLKKDSYYFNYLAHKKISELIDYSLKK